MDQIYPLAGTTTSSCASKDFDFLNYWVDKSVVKEILRGKKLQELKTRPTVRTEKYDVVSIGDTNVYSKKRSKCRSRSPRKSKKKGRVNSPKRKSSPIRKFVKKYSKSSQRCPMRIAELSVPSKRQCIDTWRTKYHVLPGIMIDRLRQHVMDLSPVVKIPDAIECFKLHKNAGKRKKKEAMEREIKRDIKRKDCKDKTKKKATKVQECRYLCAIFGHKIAKELNKPVHVTLNTELQRISHVVSIEIEKLISIGKRADNTNIKNKRIHAEVAGKISIWIASILEETAYKILEDQLKDLEEEVGPVFDLIDDLVDNVLDVCEPVPEIIEVSSSSDTYNVESSTEYEGQEEKSTADNISVEVDFPPDAESIIENLDDFIKNILLEVDFPPDAEPVIENLDDFIKNELDNIINLFDGDIPAEVEDITEIEDLKIQDYTEFENNADKEQNEFVDANDNFEVNLNESEPQADYVLQDISKSKEDTIPDQGRDTDPDKHIGNDILSEDDSNKKVKFSDISMVTSHDATEEDGQIISEYFNTDQSFAPANDRLLSNVDESWPEDMNPPMLRPSESVSKSITSLGRIMEVEESTSFMLDDDTYPKITAKVKDNTAFAKQISNTNEDDNAEISNEQLNEILYVATTEATNGLSANEIATDRNIDTKSHVKVEGEAEKADTFISKDRTINEKESTERTDEYIGQNGTMFTKDPESQNDGTERTNEYVGTDGKTFAKGQGIDYEGTSETGKYIGIDEKIYTREQKSEKDRPEETDQDEKTYIQEQAIDKDRENQADFIGSDARMMQENFNNLAAYDIIHRPSTDSTFNHDVPTKTVAYEQKLDKILEEQATQASPSLDTQSEDEVTQVKYDKILEDEATQITPKVTDEKVYFKTADKEINTSFSLVPRADKSTSVESQSLGDITKRLHGVKVDSMFTSLRIKPKVDYKVHKKSAPSWVMQNDGEPSEHFYSTPPKQQSGANDKNIRLWCKDLENGFDNLELWNGWIENTIESLKIIEMKKARIRIDKSREEFVRDWLHLKKNVDADVLTWTKLSESTKEKLKGFRNIYQNLETPPQQPKKFCNCHI